MRFRRAAVALSTLAMLIADRPGSLAPAPAAAGVRTPGHDAPGAPDAADQGPRLSPDDRSRAVRRDGTMQFTFLTITLHRREPTAGRERARADPSVGLAAPEDGLPSPPRSEPAVDRHRRSDGCVRTPAHALLGHGGAALHRRLRQLRAAETGPAPRQHRHLVHPAADSTFFGTLKARHFGATATGRPSVAAGAAVGPAPVRPRASARWSPINRGSHEARADTPHPPCAVAAAAAVQTRRALHRMLSRATTHQFAFMIRTTAVQHLRDGERRAP